MLWRMLSWERLLAQQFHLSECYHSEFQEVTPQRRGILGRKALGQAQYPQIPSRTELDITDGDSHLYLPVQTKREMLYCPIKPSLPVLRKKMHFLP